MDVLIFLSNWRQLRFLSGEMSAAEYFWTLYLYYIYRSTAYPTKTICTPQRIKKPPPILNLPNPLPLKKLVPNHLLMPNMRQRSKHTRQRPNHHKNKIIRLDGQVMWQFGNFDEHRDDADVSARHGPGDCQFVTCGGGVWVVAFWGVGKFSEAVAACEDVEGVVEEFYKGTKCCSCLGDARGG